MTERYTIFSEAGDEYRLQFTTERSNIIADRILDCLLQDGIEVSAISLQLVQSIAKERHKYWRKDSNLFAHSRRVLRMQRHAMPSLNLTSRVSLI